eukprot:sb/3473990/
MVPERKKDFQFPFRILLVEVFREVRAPSYKVDTSLLTCDPQLVTLASAHVPELGNDSSVLMFWAVYKRGILLLLLLLCFRDDIALLTHRNDFQFKFPGILFSGLQRKLVCISIGIGCWDLRDRYLRFICPITTEKKLQFLFPK